MKVLLLCIVGAVLASANGGVAATLGVGPVHGVVLGPDGKPVAHAKVLAYPKGKDPISTTSDSQGRFVYNQVGVWAPSTQIFAQYGKLDSVRPASPDERGNATVRLAPNSLITIHCKVLDNAGNFVPGARVRIDLAGRKHTGTELATVNSDPEGRCDLRNLYYWTTYRITAGANGFPTDYSRELTIEPGQVPRETDLVLDRSDSFIGGTVVDDAGKPIGGADVSAINDGKALHATTDSQGRFLLTGVPHGHTDLQIAAPGGLLVNIKMPSGVTDNLIKIP